MYKLGLEKEEEPEIKLPTYAGLQGKKKNSKKTSTSALLTTLKPLTMDHNKLCNILKEMRIPDHITCPMRNLYAGQEATVRTQHGAMNWFKIWKTQQWPQDWKRSISFQSQRKAMPKNAQTTTQLHSSHTPVK